MDMRDPDRLDYFYEVLKKDHKNYFPDWRFGQLIYNFLGWYGADPFYLEEDAFLQEWKKFIKETVG